MTYNDLRAKAAYNAMMVGANLERADMRGCDLRGINLSNANLRGADLARADLRGAILIKADLSRANLQLADLQNADMSCADLTGAYCRRTNFSYARMWLVYLRRGTFKNAFFLGADMRGADLAGAECLGARFDDAITEGLRNADMATYTWWYNPIGGQKVSLKPIPGWTRMDESVMGGTTVRENSAREKVEQYGD